MAKIVINEISQNYTYNIGNNAYAQVALPITSSWGPGYFAVEPTSDITQADLLEKAVWERFPATQKGLEAFVSQYRGPASAYRLANDYSYQMAMTLLTAGYDVLVCRLCPGAKSEGYANAVYTAIPSGASAPTFEKNKYYQSLDGGYVLLETAPSDWATNYTNYYTKSADTTNQVNVKAKYPGTFGNKLKVVFRKLALGYSQGYNMVVYVQEDTGVKTAVENLSFTFDEEESNDSVVYFDELDSAFVDLTKVGTGFAEAKSTVSLTGGTDYNTTGTVVSTVIEAASALVTKRFGTSEGATYKAAVSALSTTADIVTANIRLYKEWLYTRCLDVYDLLTDKLSYSPQRIVSPGWDDQNISDVTQEDYTLQLDSISPLQKKLMSTAYHSRCGTAMLDVPKCLQRQFVYSEDAESPGYAQKLSRYTPTDSQYDINASLFHTHSALCGPWGKYRFAGSSKQLTASPSFLTLMIQRAMILNQAAQYEWALPTTRRHNLDIGKLDYPVTKKQLDEWQKLEGVGVNIIANIPGIGTTLWGNSTLMEVPPATYQALANLSTRYLMNAIEDLVYRCGIQITFQYNNDQAYSSFYAGVTPLLDTMKNIGAIDDYLVKMSADIDGQDHVNANTVIGKIYITVNGVINDIIVDLTALPPGTDLTQFAE